MTYCFLCILMAPASLAVVKVKAAAFVLLKSVCLFRSISSGTLEQSCVKFGIVIIFTDCKCVSCCQQDQCCRV